MRSARKFKANSASFTLQGEIDEQVAQFFDRIKKEAIRPAAHAMAIVLYDEIKARVPVRMGKLQAAIYRWFDEAESDDDRKVYMVGVNKRKAPHWWLVEHGHLRRYAVAFGPDGWKTLKNRPLVTPVFVPAEPYFRPAIDAKLQAAGDAGRRRLAEKIKDIQHG
ncbi:HK97 gp10 family phage protein [Achromobacter denitrificans]|uniref:HK97 gp10 family phage protein n=1 Tax=Achromobacter denitrificans TaxID=32002 RepID=UPI00242EA8FD|nr:HK97 gp10 family phage protein [Achromobacter denitrificans]MBV2160243.1 HK97 gp10 family phage protein [Achromobacter denitrificans]